jgi:hypothetical protein
MITAFILSGFTEHDRFTPHGLAAKATAQWGTVLEMKSTGIGLAHTMSMSA